MRSLNKLLIAGLLTSSAFANDNITGYIEARKYFATSLPEYPDLTGSPAKYGLDFELHFPTAIPHFSIMAGADADTGPHQFSQIAGRFGGNINFRAIDFGIYHRSNHSIDHDPISPFISDNHIYLRYQFEVGR